MELVFAPLDVIGILLGVVAAVDFILLITIFLNRKKNDGARFFIVAAFFVATWVLSMFFFRAISDVEILIIPTKALYVVGIIIVHFLLLFSYEFLSGTREAVSRLMYIMLTAITLVLVLLIIFTDSIIAGVEFAQNGKVVSFGLLYIPYSIMMLTYLIITYSNFFNRAALFMRNNNKVGHRQLMYVIVGTGVSIFLGLIFDIILPYFGDFRGYWFGPVMNILFVAATTYAILKHHLFNLKVIATEIFIFSLWVVMLSRALSSLTATDQAINIGVLLATILIGILLIRSVLKEVETREQIELLAQDLKVTNERLKELDVLKSQFLSIASHDLRAPLTTIRNFMSLLLDGTYGKIPQAADEGMRQVFERATEMAKSVDDYLNVSRIEQGKMKYDFAETDLVKIISDTAQPFKSIAEKKGLSFALRTPADLKPIPAKADEGKLHEAFSLLIDNAIKYTPEGAVTVSVQRTGDPSTTPAQGANGYGAGRVQVIIKDTGVGISKETMPKLFKLFSTGEESRKVNTSSTGVGLYVAKAIMEAHKGTLRAESEGEGKGSAFIVELPVLG